MTEVQHGEPREIVRHADIGMVILVRLHALPYRLVAAIIS